MKERRNIQIIIRPVANRQGEYIAYYEAEFLQATFSVHLKDNIFGALALHAFAEMIRNYYGVSPELTVVDRLPNNPAVSDVLQSLEHPLATGSHHL